MNNHENLQEACRELLMMTGPFFAAYTISVSITALTYLLANGLNQLDESERDGAIKQILDALNMYKERGMTEKHTLN